MLGPHSINNNESIKYYAIPDVHSLSGRLHKVDRPIKQMLFGKGSSQDCSVKPNKTRGPQKKESRVRGNWISAMANVIGHGQYY